MPLFNVFGTCSHSENRMQQDVADFVFRSNRYRDSNYDKIHPSVIREFRVPEVGRISDLVVYFTPKKIFNIECKLNDVVGVIDQAIDHLKWVDYSIVAVPATTYISNDHKSRMIKHGIGLLLWLPGNTLVEVIYPMHNKNKNKHIRTKVNARIQKELQNPKVFGYVHGNHR